MWNNSRTRYYDGPVSDHFDGLRFFDPHGAPPNGMVQLLRFLATRERVRLGRPGPRAPSAIARRAASTARRGGSRSSATRHGCCRPQA